MKKKKHEKKTITRKQALIAAIPFIIGFIIHATCIRFIKIASGSMETTLMTHDWVMTTNAWMSGDVERGDIIMFKFNEGNKEVNYIKRVIGLPGDTVDIDKGKVYINGELLEEDYLTEPMCPYEVNGNKITYEIYDYGTETVPDYLYDKAGNTLKWYVLDAAGNKMEIDETKTYHHSFQVPEEHVFVLGDHRNTSYDSRFWNDPYVDMDVIKGKVVLRLNNFGYVGKE